MSKFNNLYNTRFCVDYKLQTYKICLKIIKDVKRGLIGKWAFFLRLVYLCLIKIIMGIQIYIEMTKI